MPLRDHFRAPLKGRSRWEAVHAQWPAMMVLRLNAILPERFSAEPRVHVGSSFEVDIGALEERENLFSNSQADGNLAVAVAHEPDLSVETAIVDPSEYEVSIWEDEGDQERRLVAAVEIVSPANKDRPEHRRDFVAKCAALLNRGVSVAVVDIVTGRHANLYCDLLDWIGQIDPQLTAAPPATYAASCRTRKVDRRQFLDAWRLPLQVGDRLPTLPLWLTESLSVPLELEASYEETCRGLRIA